MLGACPFSVGQTVIYRPSDHAYGWTAPESMPMPGTPVTIAAVKQGGYIVIEGWEDHPGGGMFWANFSPD